MINVLGFKRVVVILVLLGLNCLVAAMMYLYFKPAQTKLNGELLSIRTTIASNRTEIGKLRSDFAYYQEQKGLFAELMKLGFFTDQDRFRAPERLEAIKSVSKLLGARYEIGSAKKIPNASAEKAGHVLLSTPVRIYDIESMDDSDIYTFIYWLDNAFIGQTSVTWVELSSINVLDEVMLRRIGGGEAVPLIQGAVDFDWRTMIPEAQYDELMNQSGETWP